MNNDVYTFKIFFFCFITFQISSKQLVKPDAMGKPDFIKQESLCTPMTQIPQHIQVQGKDHQGIGVYTNMYQRHPLTLASQQLSRDEELRRFVHNRPIIKMGFFQLTVFGVLLCF